MTIEPMEDAIDLARRWLAQNMAEEGGDTMTYPTLEQCIVLARSLIAMAEENARWKALAARHNLELRAPGCVCTWEHGDSACPVHPTCANCGCTEPHCERLAKCDYPVKVALAEQDVVEGK